MDGCVHCLFSLGTWENSAECSRPQLPARLAMAQLAPGRDLHPSQREEKVLRLWRSSGSFCCILYVPKIWHLVLSSWGRTPQCCETKAFLRGDIRSCACSHSLCAQPS